MQPDSSNHMPILSDSNELLLTPRKEFRAPHFETLLSCTEVGHQNDHIEAPPLIVIQAAIMAIKDW